MKDRVVLVMALIGGFVGAMLSSPFAAYFGFGTPALATAIVGAGVLLAGGIVFGGLCHGPPGLIGVTVVTAVAVRAGPIATLRPFGSAVGQFLGHAGGDSSENSGRGGQVFGGDRAVGRSHDRA